MNDWKEKIAFKGDKILWYIVIMLMIVSVMVVYSSTGRLAYNEKAGNTFFYLIKQLFLIGGCFGVMFIVQSIHYRYFYKYAGVLLFVSMILLVCAAFGGTNINGAGRWIRLPLIGLTFQPSELAKIAIMMFTARILSEAQTDTHCDDSVLQKFLLFVGPVILLIFMDNFSTSALIGAVCFILFMIARMRWRLLAMTLGTALAAIALVLILGIYVPQVKEWGRIGTMVNRITDFAKGGEDGDGYSYQSVQARIAVAKGGLMGSGPGNSTQRNFLPHPYSDFIYAIVIEEYGLGGGAFIMLLYAVILFRVGVIGRKSMRKEVLNDRGMPDIFPALLVVGLGLTIVLQAMINMGVCVGLLPVTGQTLPLVSMGGTSLLFTSAAFGVILSIAHTFSPEGEKEESERLKMKSEKQGRKNRREEYVADAPEYGFNEFLQLGGEYGLIGLCLFISITGIASGGLFKRNTQQTGGVSGALSAFLVFACFSYPLHMLPMAMLFVLLLAWSVNVGAKGVRIRRWAGQILWLPVMVLGLVAAWRLTEKETAYKTWKTARAYFRQGDYQEALNRYTPLFSALSDRPAFVFEFGECQFQNAQYGNATAIFLWAAELSADPMVYNKLGKNYQALKQYDRAEKAYVQAAHMIPHRIYPLYLLALLYREMGDMEKARDMARQVIGKEPKVWSPAVEEMKTEMKQL